MIKNGGNTKKLNNMEDNPITPGHLSMEARGWWDRITSEWEMEESSLMILQSALESFDRMREAQKIIRDEGIIVQDRFGQARKNPACDVERDAKGSMLRALKSLNLDLEPLNDSPGRPVTQGRLW